MKNLYSKRHSNTNIHNNKIFSFLLALFLSITIYAEEFTKPNILWITSEDLSAKWLGCYGNETINTPNIDKFASESFLYSHAFATAPVCAVARSSWITGINPVSIGTVYMRCKTRLPEQIKLYPDQLRANGYFASNHTKCDYNISNRYGKRMDEKKGKTKGMYLNTWDSYELYGWRNPKRKKGQPFFQVYNIGNGHESGLHKEHKGGLDYAPENMALRAYHPDIPEMRKDYAKYQTIVSRSLEARFKSILDELEKDGLTDDTVVIYTTDHGGIVGRSKRFLYDSGTHVAHMVRIPEKFKQLWPTDQPGSIIDRPIAFIDMPKTWLAITGSEIPKEMQGTIFLGPKTEKANKYVYLQRQRMDAAHDMQRAVRSKKYLYIRQYEPFRPNGQYLQYLWKAPSMKAWLEYHQAGLTNETTGAFFNPKPIEQLFDCEEDPDNVNNLAKDPNFAQIKKEMVSALKGFQNKFQDCGFIPEATLDTRIRKNNTTIYEFLRNPKLYDQAKYMAAAELSGFATKSDLPKILNLLTSTDQALQYWGIVACLNLKNAAYTDEIKAAINKIALLDLNDHENHDVVAMAALYQIKNEYNQPEGYKTLGKIINSRGMASKRAWSNIYLMGKEVEPFVSVLDMQEFEKTDLEFLNELKKFYF